MARPAALVAVLAACVAAAISAVPARAQNGGGLYIAGAGETFAEAARQALAESGGGRFFVLLVPPETEALAASGASAEAVQLRSKILASGGSLVVCRRDVDSGAVPAAGLMAGVQVVRGWPQPGGPQLLPNSDYYPDETPGALPTATEQLRRLRSTCSS